MTSEKIMVIADDLLVGEQLRQDLISMNFEVGEVYTSSVEALQSAREIQPDLILMDISLQGQPDDFEISDRIQNELGIPMVYLIASNNPKVINYARQ